MGIFLHSCENTQRVGEKELEEEGHFCVDCPCAYIVCHLLISILTYHFQCSLTSHALADNFFSRVIKPMCLAEPTGRLSLLLK